MRRKELLVKGEYYHVYNRSSSNLDIFEGINARRALELLDFYRYPHKIRYSKYKLFSTQKRREYISNIKKNNTPFVEILAYALMPDHFHLLLRQLTDNGIKISLTNFQNAFAKYYNLKHSNRGSVFINNFKAKRIPNDEALLQVSRYIHLNLTTSYLVKSTDDLINDKRTSLSYYLKNKNDGFIGTELILELVGSGVKYKQFVANRINYQRELKRIKKYLLD